VVLPCRYWRRIGAGLDFKAWCTSLGAVEFPVQRRVLIALAIFGSALILSGCAGPCGWIWDAWVYPPKTCHRQAIGQ
jgi:hypothetical protein